MDIYKEYLTGKIDFQTLYEELDPVDVYDMYAGEWVLSRPTPPEGNIRQTLKEDIRPRWVRAMERVQQGILGEGIKALIKESKNTIGILWFAPRSSPERTFDSKALQFEKFFEDISNVNFNIFGNDDEGIRPIFYSSYIEEIIPEISPDYPKVENDILNLPKIKFRGFSARLEISNVESFFDFMISYYDDLSWGGSFGGEPWARIARELKDFWKRYPDNSFTTIDHVVDLAHNTSAWVDKFKNSGELLKALNIKFEADSPKDWIDKISDRKIKSGVERARV